MIHPHSTPRNGTLVVCVLVCLLVASTMATAITRSALRARRELRLGHQMRQTELFLDAGILRAAGKTQGSEEYQGEVWQPTTAIAHFEGALVEISVKADERQAGWRRVNVIASLGTASDGAERKRLPLTRRTHTFRIQSSDSSLTSESSTAE
jgi:hypothetical protein